MSRFTIDFDPEFDGRLSDLARTKHLAKAEIIRRALATYEYLCAETMSKSTKVSITDANDAVVKDVILP